MARFEFRLPDIGEGVAEAEIVAWHVELGDEIEEDQPLVDMMTDKATVEMESPVAGKVVELAGEVGDRIAIGSVLATLETKGSVDGDAAKVTRKDEVALGDGLIEEHAALAEAIPSTGEKRRESGDRRGARDRRGEKRKDPDRRKADRRDPKTPQPSQSKRPILASPAVRQRARDLGIDLASIKSASERIRHSDLDSYLLYNGGALSSGKEVGARQDERVKVTGLRRKIAENMEEAKRRIPHFTYVEEVDVTALEQTRAMMNADRGDQPKLTLLPLLITAMCRALPDYPQINARYDDDANVVTRSGAVHMGVATQTKDGLAVPVIRDAQARNLWDLASEISRLAEAARAGKATREELSGSTITISSLGAMGGIASTPVINRPEVAIIAVNKIEERPVVVDGEIVVRKRMNLSFSGDHRVVDGWDAASFVQEVKMLLENPLKLLSLR